MPQQTDNLGWTIPTPGEDSGGPTGTQPGGWPYILNELIDGEIEPAVAEALSNAGDPPVYDGGVLLKYYDDDTDQIKTSSYTQIQQAINDMPLQDSEYGPDVRTGGDVFIYSKAGENAYDQGQIVMNRKGKLRAIGTYAELSHRGSDATVLVTNDGSAPSPDDVYLTGLWIENLGSGMALRSTMDETHIEDINLEDAGDIAVDFEGDRCTAFNCEMKGGAFRVSGDQAYINHVLVHNEIGHGFVNGWEIAGNYNTCINCHGWLNGDNAGAVISGNKNTFVGSAGQSPKRIEQGRATYGLEITGDNNTARVNTVKTDTAVHIAGSKNVIQLNAVNTNTGIEFESTGGENIVTGYIAGPVVRASSDTRNVANGQSVNSGDPRITGNWSGHADFAYQVGATVWDTSVSPNVPYQAGPDGNWREG